MQATLAIPPLPTEFYGRIREYNNNASSGGMITAYDSSGTLCGSFQIVTSGLYGLLTCSGDDPETAQDEGPVPTESVSFRYRGAPTTLRGDNIWEPGIFKNVTITYPVVFCGDLFCDVEYETNLTCPSDCPVYNTTTNISINSSMNFSSNQTTPSTGGETTGTGGRGGGGGSASGTPRTATISTKFPFNESAEFEGIEGLECEEKWSCTNWTICDIDEIQTRTCIDRNDCGTFELKPIETQKCVYTPTCEDNVKNGLEEGIDCGGLCPPCISCFDGIQNCHDGECEEGIDCGGPCSPCPSCFDNLKNCHDGSCEDGIDCGGSCEKKCPETQIAKPIVVCKKDINPLNSGLILLFIAVLLTIIANTVHSELKVHTLKKSKTFKGIERARKIFSIRRKELLFTLTLILLTVIIYLYYFFFIMCETEYQFLWVLVFILLLGPILIHQLIKYLEYNENKKIIKMQNLLKEHENKITLMLRIENENLGELLSLAENSIVDAIYSKEVKNMELEVVLKEALGNLKLIKENCAKGIKDLDENKFISNINDFSSDKYKTLVEMNMNLGDLSSRLGLILNLLEDRKKLYEELNKIKNAEKELDNENSQPPEKKEDKDLEKKENDLKKE
jgi:hypothetical protein